MLSYILVMGISYLIGALPFGYVLVKLLRGVDIRTVGSGSSGATNVSRVLGFKGFISVFGFDLLKGFVTIVALRNITDNGTLIMASAIMLLVGHVYSIFLHFRGGKGVATGVGIALALFPMAALFGILGFAVSLVIKKTVSISSITAALSMVFAALVMDYHWTVRILVIILAGFVIYNHRTNMRRIKAGTEPQVEIVSFIMRK